MDEPKDDTLSKKDAAAMIGCDVRTLERRTHEYTREQGRIPVGGVVRPAEIRYTLALVRSLMPTPGGGENTDD